MKKVHWSTCMSCRKMAQAQVSKIGDLYSCLLWHNHPTEQHSRRRTLILVVLAKMGMSYWGSASVILLGLAGESMTMMCNLPGWFIHYPWYMQSRKARCGYQVFGAAAHRSMTKPHSATWAMGIPCNPKHLGNGWIECLVPMWWDWVLCTGWQNLDLSSWRPWDKRKPGKKRQDYIRLQAHKTLAAFLENHQQAILVKPENLVCVSAERIPWHHSKSSCFPWLLSYGQCTYSKNAAYARTG